jgi:hypothetical protein
VEGWAEAPGFNPVVPGRNGAVFAAYLDTIIKPTLVGENPRQIDRHWETLATGKEDRLYMLPANVVGVIDVALWDLFGKEPGQPVYTLMGGAARTTIPLYWSTGSGWNLSPEEMLDAVRTGHSMGFQAFKIRMDWKGWRQDANPEKDYQMFKLVREFLADGQYLGFDATTATRSRRPSSRDAGLKNWASTISRSQSPTGICRASSRWPTRSTWRSRRASRTPTAGGSTNWFYSVIPTSSSPTSSAPAGRRK